MKLGAEPKKVKWLAGLLTAAGGLFYVNVFSGPDAPVSSRSTPQQVAPASARPVSKNTPPPNISRSRSGIRGAIEEFKPTFKGLDANGVDPTLRLDLLARVQNVSFEGGGRSLFQFASAPAPPVPKPVLAAKIPVKTAAQIAQEQSDERARASMPPPAPKAPPITLKFYGYSTPRRDGLKRAFFLDGEEIIVASEGETIKRRYKVVRISNTSVVMEDTEFKSQQTLTIQAEQT